MREEEKLFEVKEMIKSFRFKGCHEIIKMLEEIDLKIPEKEREEALNQIEEVLKNSGVSGEAIKGVVKNLYFEKVQRRREWSGKHSYDSLIKTKGSKYPYQFIAEIHEMIPLSIKGFDVEYGNESTTWRKKIGPKRYEFTIPVGKKTAGMKPAAGNLAKNTVKTFFRFAIWRGTPDPGPIMFKDFLELLGQSNCSMETRKRIKRYCEACAKTIMDIRGYSKKGRENYFRITPFFKDVYWTGECELTAKVYPVINDRFTKMLTDEGLNQYIYFLDRFLKPQKELTDRDAMAQDIFKLYGGLSHPVVFGSVKNFLFKFGQFTEKDLKNKSLKRIKGFVNKAFSQAKANKTIFSFRIRNYRTREKYLNQPITFYPEKPEIPKEKARLSPETRREIDYIAEAIYEIASGEGIYTDFETEKLYMLNAARHGYMDCIKQAYHTVSHQYIPEEPIDDYGNYQNSIMLFWDIYNDCKSMK